MKKILSGILILSAFFLGSCKKDFLTSLAVNPNTPSQATPQLVLTAVLASYGDIISGGGTYQTPGLWMGYWNFSGNYGISINSVTYHMTSGSPQIWDTWYPTLTNVNYIEQNTNGQKNMEYFAAIAKTLKAVGFEYLVDVYNNVAYSQAFGGVKNFFPTYDNGQKIYEDLAIQLDSAIVLIQQGENDAQAINPQGSDIMFKGKMDKWARFANTVKLRLLLRQSAMPGRTAYITQELAKTASVGYLGAGQDALVNPGYSNSDQTKQNPLWRRYGVSPGGGLYSDSYNFIRGGGQALNFYKNNNDPRLFYFYAPKGIDPTSSTYFTPDTIPADYFASDFGDENSRPANSGTSGMGPGIMQGPTAPSVIMLASESLFLQAEAAYDGLTSGNPLSLYNAAITESFRYLGVPNYAAASTAYYSQNINNVNYTVSANKLSAILTQKWAALNGICNAEAYNDWRRTGFPVVQLSKDPSNTHSHLPYRYLYPQSEFDKNGAAVEAQGISQEADAFSKKIFWMQ